eukprot:3266785-Alexandrium_andersonii.AAC.1
MGHPGGGLMAREIDAKIGARAARGLQGIPDVGAARGTAPPGRLGELGRAPGLALLEVLKSLVEGAGDLELAGAALLPADRVAPVGAALDQW